MKKKINIENIEFQIRSGDVHGTLATIVSNIRQKIEPLEIDETNDSLQYLEKYLMYLHKNTKVIVLSKTKNEVI